MKRRIVRIAAGSLIVLAWLAAGVYAFWGGNQEGETPPVDAQAMSQQIAAVNLKKPAANPVKPAFAVEDAPAELKKPAADPLFNRSNLTKESTFKPRSGAFQPAAITDNGPPSAYGDATLPEISVPLGGNAGGSDDATVVPMPDPQTLDTAAGAPPEFNPNPLRGAPRALHATGDAPLDHELAQEPPLAPPPARFNGLAREGEPNLARPTPASRFSAPPTNELPAEVASTNTYGAPPGRDLGASRLSDNGARETAETSIASARPGQAAFEGSQAPSLVIEKLAPAEIQVGKAAKFEIHVRNAGQTAAQNVVVTDHIPSGTQLVDAKPTPEQGAGGLLVWQLGKLEAGADKTITIELMPEQEGEIGSVAEVTFAAAASVKTVCTKPQLVVEHLAPAKVMIGELVTLQITISNPGTGAATNVVLQEDVPEGLAHSSGKELEYEVGTLRPGESRKLELQLEAAKAGVVQNTLTVRGDANLNATHSAQIEVIAPQLEVAMTGPKRRYLDRQATYTVSIANPGTATARDVEVVAYLPKGMKFVSTDREGQYDPQNHAVYWSLEELPAAQQGNAQLVAIPFEAGEQKLRVEGHAQQNLTSSDEGTILVEAISQLAFEIVDEADPIEVGADTVYQIRVTNEGSKAATNVQVIAALPPEFRPVSADGATRGAMEGQNVVFEPLGKLAPQAEAIFKIQATGLRTGDYTIRVQITSEDLQTPVTKEEPTRVYADR